MEETNMNKKKLLALLMALVMTLTLVPVTALAEGDNEAKIGDTEYATLQAAIAAAQDGDTIELLTDIELAEEVIVTTTGELVHQADANGKLSTENQILSKQLSSLTIDGKGYTISMADTHAYGGKYRLSSESAFFFGAYGSNDTGSIPGNVYTLKNITFSGFDCMIIHAKRCTVNLEGCTFQNNHITVPMGSGDSTDMIETLNAALKIDGCTFTGNTTSGKYGLIYTNNQVEGAYIQLTNNLFENNGTQENPVGGNGLALLSNCAAHNDAVTNNTFSGNYISMANGNAAVVYASNPIENISGNLFIGNHITAPSDKKAGVIVLGSGTVGSAVTENAFVSNTLSGATTKIATMVVGSASNISDNYWSDGNAPVTGTNNDIYLDGNPAVTNTNYATGYDANVGANGCTVTLATPVVAKIGSMEYETLAAAFAAANESTDAVTIIVLQSCTLDNTVTVQAGKNVTLNLNGNTVGSTMNGADADDVMIAIEAGATMTVTGNGVITNQVGGTTYSKGLIHNAGTLTVNNGTFNDYGQGCGYALKNSGTMTVKAGTRIESFGEASGNAAIYNATGELNIEDGVTIVNHATDGIVDPVRFGEKGYGVYAIRIDAGTTTIGELNAETPTSVDGNRGAFAVNGGTLVINSGVFTGHIYRAMWITNDYAGTFVTINGGTFLPGNSGSVGASVDDGKQDKSDVAVTVNDGYFGGSFYHDSKKDSKNTWTFAIKGGYYKDKPSANLIADGYEAVAITESVGNITYKWQVGKIVDIVVDTPTVIEDNNVTYEQYSQTKSIVDKTETPIVDSTNITVNVKPTTSDSTSIAPAALNNITTDAKAALVKAAVAEAPNNANTTVNVTIQVAKDKDNESSTENAVVYNVHPQAIIQVQDSETSTTVELTNEQISAGHSFSFYLDVSSLDVAVNDKVAVNHIHEDGTEESLGLLDVRSTAGGMLYVYVTDITSFSEFKVQKITTTTEDASVSFNGASLRRRVKLQGGNETNEVVNTSADIRMEYSWTLPTGAVIDKAHSYFQWRAVGNATLHQVAIANCSATGANLVLTGVKRDQFNVGIETTIHIAYKIGNVMHYLDGVYTGGDNWRSVESTASKLIDKDGVPDQWKDYAKYLLTGYTGYEYNITSYTILRDPETNAIIGYEKTN